MDVTSLPYNIPDLIYIYKNESTIDWVALKEYLENILDGMTNIELRENFILFHSRKEEELKSTAEKLVRTKVFDVSDPKKVYEPFTVEVDSEMESIIDPKKKVSGMLYDGFRLQKLYRELLPKAELSFKHLHIMFTERSIGTWDKGDGRYHARTSVYGFPSIISTSGIVEAPAKPREFYILRKALIASGMTRELVEEELKSKFKGRYIDYDDERLTDIVKGYTLQAYFYHTTFEPFCEDKNCRLYNAHWQEDMIHSQLEGKDFCDRHEEILEGIRTRKL